MTRVGFWTPIPPQRSGIADYSEALLSELRRHWDITVVIDERLAYHSATSADERVWQPPPGVDVVDFRTVRAGQFDLNVYQMGNNAEYHAYMHRHALDVPGLLVLHDPSLYDFYVALCGGNRSRALLDEAEYDLGMPISKIPTVRIDGHAETDRLSLLMSRRLIESSVMTVVHSDWARDALRKKVPGASVQRVLHPAKILPHRAKSAADEITFGILGGINRHKRVLQSLAAFEQVHREHPSANLMIAGRVDMRALVDEIEHFVNRNLLTRSVETRYEIGGNDLDRMLSSCDVLLALRWPTAGETSGLVMRAFGAGIPVITSDVPQFREFDDAFCWRVPIEASAERRELTRLMRAAANDLDAVTKAGRLAQRFVECRATFPIAAKEYSDAFRMCLEGERSFVRRSESVMPPVVNAIGSWTATTGIAEAARGAVRALSEAGISVALSEYEIDVPKNRHRVTSDLAAMPRGRPGAIDMCFLNINEMHGVSDNYLRPGPPRHLIAYWFWELPELPPQLESEVWRFDEIWVASRFVKANFVKYTPAPVCVMPAVVQPERRADLSRHEFGLSEYDCVFLFNFDANSGLARKNPFGVIEAFKLAFADLEDRSRVRLVMKTLNLARWPEAEFDLRRRLAEVGGIVVDEELTADEMAALTDMSDVYVSLHRAEGFGLGMAEAMYFGVPVIATRYSGSEEFLNSGNSCGVGYRLRRIDLEELRYNPSSEELYRSDMWWADPDARQAARWMRMLHERPEIRRRIGAAGAATVRQRFSSATAGMAMRQRLYEIVRWGSKVIAPRPPERVPSRQVPEAPLSVITRPH